MWDGTRFVKGFAWGFGNRIRDFVDVSEMSRLGERLPGILRCNNIMDRGGKT